MPNKEIPFHYTISISEDELSMFEEDFVYFVINNYKKVDLEYLYPIEFPSDKNGVKGTIMSGNFRDCLTKCFFKCTYSTLLDDVSKDPQYHTNLDFINYLIVKILFELHYNLDFLSKSVRYLHFEKKKFDLVKRNKSQIETIEKFIEMLDPSNSIKYELRTSIEVYGFELDLKYNQDSLKRVLFDNYIINTIDVFFKNINSDGELTFVEFAYMFVTFSSKSFEVSQQSLKHLVSFSKKLELNSTKNSNWGRLYILLLKRIDSLIDETYVDVYKKSPSEVRGCLIQKNLAILHSLSIFDLIPKEDKIYDILYREDTTRHEVKDAVKDFMRNKLYK